MPLAEILVPEYEEQATETRAVVCPWVAAPYGVVSLLNMLEFYARDYVEIAHEFGKILAIYDQRVISEQDFSNILSKVSNESDRLGLVVTKEALLQMIAEVVKQGYSRAPLSTRASLDPSRWAYHIECVYATLRAELSSVALKAISGDKKKYCDPKWLFESSIYKNFPGAWQEFQSAGRCHAYGENTACAFHLNRALEWGLKSLAVRLGKRFDRNGWEKHLEDIEKALQASYAAAGQRTPEQKFYSEAAVQFGNMKVAWRNPTMHVDAKYDDKEGSNLLTAVEQFMTHLADNGLVEPASA